MLLIPATRRELCLLHCQPFFPPLGVRTRVTFGNPQRQLPEAQWLEVFLPGGRILKAALKMIQYVFYSQTAPNKEDFVQEDVVIPPNNTCLN